MFESAEIGHKLDKARFKREEPKVRKRLLDLQGELLKKHNFPVIILVNGVDGAGKGETVNLFNEWMDPRHIHTHAFPEPSDEEIERPQRQPDPANGNDGQPADRSVDRDRPVRRVRQRHERDRRERREEHQDAGALERVARPERQAAVAAELPPRQEAADDDDQRCEGGQSAAAAQWAAMHPQSPLE